jgi:hypothetical protein
MYSPDWLRSVLLVMVGPSFRFRPAALSWLALLLAPASGAAPATATADDLSAAVTAATAELLQGWSADPTTAALPFPSVRLLPPDASVQGTCNPKASARVPAPRAAYCASSGEVLLVRGLLEKPYGQTKPPMGRALVTYWIATALAERLLPAATEGAGADALRVLQASCRGGVLLGASPAPKAFPDATPLLIAARAAYGDRYAMAVGSASQRGYALLTGAFVGLGFALEENLNYYDESGGSVVIGRFITANFMHVALTGIAAHGLYITVRSGFTRVADFAGSFVGVVAAHGLYDLVIILDRSEQLGIGFLSIVVLFFIARHFFTQVEQETPTTRAAISPLAVFFIGSATLVAALFIIAACVTGTTAAIAEVGQGSLGVLPVGFMFWKHLH